MVRTAALLLTALTGACGLVYEVTWQRILATLLGSHSEATAVVLALFLGSLALGYAWFGARTAAWVAAAQRAGSSPRLLQRYGLIEGSLGVWALAFPLLFRAVQALSVAGPAGAGLAGFALDAALSALLVAPPSILMGGTIPILTQALARSREDATRFHALVYAFNAAGACVGALAASFVLIPLLGLAGVLATTGVANLTAGAAFVWLGRGERSAVDLPADAVASPAEGGAALAWIAVLCGFAMMAVQTVLNRLGALSFGASQFTFSIVVSVFVLGIALGSFATSALGRVPARLWLWNLWALWALLAVLYGPLQDAPYWAHVLRASFGSAPAEFVPYHLAAALGTLAVVGLPVAVSGATLPLLFDRLRGATVTLGGVAGSLYSWNTLGSLAGALLGGYALLYWLDLHHVYRLALAAIAMAAAIATGRQRAGSGAATSLLAVAPPLLVVALLPAWAPERLASGAFRVREANAYTHAGADAFFAHYEQGRILFYDDDPAASIAVKEAAIGDLVDRAIVTNGKSDSSVVGERVTTTLLGLVPALLAERAERAFVIGYGTGMTASELAGLESMREVVVAEISPAVIEAAPLFDYANRDASRDPKLRIVPGDAFRSLLRAQGTFDVIASAPSNAWVAGTETLYTREFLAASRDRLNPGGVHAQWFQLYEADGAMLELMLRTYADVFDRVGVWYASGTDLLLLGFRGGTEIDLARLAERSGRPDFAAGLARCEIRSVAALVAHELLPPGVVNAALRPGPLHTLWAPRLGYQAALAFFSGGVARVPRAVRPDAAAVGRRDALVGRLRALRGGAFSELEWRDLVAETCAHRAAECVTLLAHWQSAVPDSGEREKILAQLRAHPEAYGHIPLALVDPLRLLVEGSESEVPLRPERAEELSRYFIAFYHHAAPFRRAALDRLWQRCESDPSWRDECRHRRERLAGVLGPEPTQ